MSVASRKRRAPKPKRFGPEWWAVYAASFVDQFERMRNYQDFDTRASHRSSDAEHAAAVADVALDGFADAAAGGCIEGVDADD